MALSLLELGVLEAVPLLRHRAEGLGEQRELARLDRELAALGGRDDAVGTDDVPEVQVAHEDVVRPHGLLGEHELDVARCVAQGEERELAVTPKQDDAAGDRNAIVGGRSRREIGVPFVQVRRVRGGLVTESERLDPTGTQRLQRLPPGSERLLEPSPGLPGLGRLIHPVRCSSRR